MPSMTPLTITVLMFAEIWFLGFLVLILHRLSPRFGLIPLVFLLGALAAALQFRSLGLFSVSVEGLTLNIALESYLILPILLLGMLAIYVVNGSVPARNVLSGMVFVAALVVLFQSLPSIQVKLSGTLLTPSEGLLTIPPRIPLASALALPADLIILVVTYQVVSNLQGRFPSSLAGGISLFAALWGDAIIFPILAYLGLPNFLDDLPVNLLGKTFAGLALTPFILIYLQRLAPAFPDTAATTPRPALDIFTTVQQLEARARYHYNLLHTLTAINQLVVRAEDQQDLLDQACQLLIAHRDYLMVWIGLLNEEQKQIHPTSKAGKDAGYLDSITITLDDSATGRGPTGTAARTGQPSILKDIRRDPNYAPWRDAALERGYQASAAFPMRYAGRILGVLNVYAQEANAFDQEEIFLLQEMADDLAYALTSLDARRQGKILHTAAETMQDGLVITNPEGIIIYANPALAQMLRQSVPELGGLNIRSFFSSPRSKDIVDRNFHTLLEVGSVAFDYENRFPDGHTAYYSIRASLVHGIHTSSTHIVISVRDTTRRRQYERQLLTLNRFTTDMVQVQDVLDLRLKAFEAGEELLQADASALFILDDDGRMVAETHTHNLPAEYANRIAQDVRGLPGERAFQTRMPVSVDDVLQDPNYGERIHFMTDYGIRALLILPVLYQEKPIGALTLYYNQPHRFLDEELQLGLTLSQTLAIAFQNARLYQAEHNQRQFAEALAQAAAALNKSLDLDTVLDEILEQTLSVVNCRSVNLMLVEGESARVVRHLDRTDPGEIKRSVTGVQFSLAIPSFHRMLQTGQPILISDTVRDTMWRQLSQTSWIRSYAAAPLMVHQQIIGFLNLNSDQPNFFTEETVQRLQAFAATAATAIQNAQLYKELQQHTIELEDRVQKRTSELSAAKERIERILVSVPDAVFVLDETDHLVQSNPAGETLMVQAEQQGLDLFSEVFLSQLKAGTISEEKAILEVQGRAYQALASSLPFKGYTTGLVIVFRDVTRFRELDQMKTQFVSDVSHELRTPLTNLTLYLDLMSTIQDPSKGQIYLATLRRETERLTFLIEDLLAISRLEANRVEIDMKPVDVNRLVSNLAKDRAPMAASRHLTLTSNITPDLPPASADSRLLTQVLSNLLTNALNYTPEKGKIHLQTELKENGDAPWITISVQDSGVGIQPEEINQIFERFYRGSASQTTEAPGTGLGLAISSEIMERLSGRITVESQPDQGSIFTVWLRAVL